MNTARVLHVRCCVAAATLTAVVRAGAEEWSALAARAREAARDGLHDVAERWWAQAWTNAPTPADRRDCAAGLAAARVAAGRAREALDRLDAETPPGEAGSAVILFWRATAERALGNLEGALESLSRIPADGLTPQVRERAGRLLADLLWAVTRTDEAIAALAGLVREAPDEAAAVRHGLVLARRWVEAGERGQAVELLQGLLRRATAGPEVVAIRLQLAHLNLEVGRLEEAVELARPLAENVELLGTARARAWTVLAQAEEKRGNRVAAADAWEAAVKHGAGTPEEADALFGRAAFRIRTGDHDLARELLQDALRRHPRHSAGVELEMDLAERLLEARRYEAALAAYQTYLETAADPLRRAEALMGKGWCLLELDRPAEAVPVFDRAADLFRDPMRRRTAAIKAADALTAAGRHAEALARYRALIRAQEGGTPDPALRLMMAECLVQLGQVLDALQELRSIESAAGDRFSVLAALRRARLHEQLGEREAALAAYEAVIRREGGGGVARTAHLSRGLLRYRLAEPESALEDFDAVLRGGEADAASDHAAYMRVWCLYLLGREEEAVAACTAFLAARPTSPRAPDAQYWLAERAWHRGDATAAEREFLLLADRWSESPLASAALFAAGRAAAASANYLRAVEHYNRLLSVRSGGPLTNEARFAQGDALAELGRFDAALLSFEEVIRAAPDSLLGLLARGRKGDCHFTLAAREPARYDEAAACYQAVADHPSAPADVRLQALYKAARCHEMLGRKVEALERYLDAAYRHIEERRAGRPGAPLWFARAAFAAAILLERGERWGEAARLYRRVMEDGGAAAVDAQAHLKRLEETRGEAVRETATGSWAS